MQEIRRIYFKGLMGFLFAALLCYTACGSVAREQKDMVLVIDTSLSMVGYGGKNILPQVKESLVKFIDQLNVGDSISFVTFDTDVKLYPTIYIHDKNDKDILRKYLSVIDAKGKWTYTQQMLRQVFKKAVELEDKEKKRQRVIVVMTDALDDPPPGHKGERLNIKKISKEYNEKDWFIFLVSLGDLAKDARIKKVQQDLKEGVSRYTKVVDAGKSPDKAIGKDLIKDVDKMMLEKKEREKTFLSSPFFYAILLLLLIGIVFILLRRFAALKVQGTLDYWNHGLLDPYINTYNLSRQNAQKILIGRGTGNNLNVRDIEVNEPFCIVGTRKDGKVGYVLQWGNSYNIEFVNGDPGALLKDGDIFKVANYTFRYNVSK